MCKLSNIPTLIIAACCFAIFPNEVLVLSYAQDANTNTEYLTVEDAVEIAINNNPIIKSKGHNVEAAVGKIKQAKLLHNPEIKLATEEVPTNEIGLNQSQNMISLSQKLEIGGKRRLRTEVANEEKNIIELDLHVSIANITAKVKKAFYDVLTAQDKHKLASESVEIAKSLKNISDERFKAGDVARIEVLKADVELSNAKMKVMVAERNRLNSIKKLQTVMGTPNTALKDLFPITFDGHQSLELEKLEDLFLENYPVLQAQKKIVDLSHLKITEAKRNAVPDINASIGYKRLSATNEDTIQAGIDLPLPLFNRNQGKIIEAKALSQKAKKDEESIRNELLLQLNNTYSLYTLARAQVSYFVDTIIPQAEESLKISKQGYKHGEFDYLEVLDAQRTLANTKISYLKIMNELFSSMIEIEKLVGVKISDIK